MEDISVEQLKNRSDTGERLIVIDVREPHEYAEARISLRFTPAFTLFFGAKTEDTCVINSDEALYNRNTFFLFKKWEVANKKQFFDLSTQLRILRRLIQSLAVVSGITALMIAK